jgi:phosphatidylglycerophosphatase A
MGIVKRIIMALSTFFYVGYLPAPGTSGSMAGIFLFYIIRGNTRLHLELTLFCLFLGIALSTEAEKITGKKDARFIVIDEVTGMLLSLLFLPYDIRLVVLAFLIFRILDILKPYPADNLQSLPGGLGVMADDIIAGIYTNIILHSVLRLASFRLS